VAVAGKHVSDDELRLSGHTVYYEPLRPAPVLARQARRLRYEALLAERAGDPRAQQLYREAIERFVDAFLVDRAGHAACFTDAHAIGRHVAERYWCPMKDAGDGYWTVGCGVLALHRRLGASWAGPTIGRCSVCGAGDLECEHIPGQWYDGVHCHRIVHEVDLRDISLVPFPDDPRTYRMEVARTPREIRAARGRPLRRGEVPLCTHCTERCDGADRGPRVEDVDQSLWHAPTPGEEGGR
jgi:hypothetical protein